MDDIERDFESLQVQYREAKAKLAVASTGEQLEQDRQAERFEVIEQATVPGEPIKPNRSRIFVIGTIMSAAAEVSAWFCFSKCSTKLSIGAVISSDLSDQADHDDSLHQERSRPVTPTPYVQFPFLLALAGVVLFIAAVHVF